MKGLRFERIGKDRYYNVVFHMGESYIPVSDKIIDELRSQSLLPVERFIDLLIDRPLEGFRRSSGRLAMARSDYTLRRHILPIRTKRL